MNERDGYRAMEIILFSFGFKHGSPEADSVWDIRFLPNPYYLPEMKNKTGREADVAAYVLDSRAAQDFFAGFEPFLESFLSSHAVAGRESIRLAVGCTGGRHRSVAVAEHIRQFLEGRDYAVQLYHRDLEKD